MNRKVFFPLAILLIILSSGSLGAQRLPEPMGFVNDFAGVIDSRSSAEMEGIARALQQKTGAEIAVVTVQSIEPYGSVAEYSIELATAWGIGKEGEDTGILILLAMQEKGIPVTYLLYPDEGHGLVRPENAMSFTAVSEIFLSEFLGGRYEPIGDDFEGSSITVPNGAEYIPGLAEALPE